MDINKALQIGREALLKNGLEPREARLLLAFTTKLKKEELIVCKECSEDNYKQYIELINRRIKGEPFAYIVGHKEFMKLDFKVDKNVLIPREDTEILVQEVIQIAKEKQLNNLNSENESKKIKILDMCTGSGCIAVSLAKFIKDAELVAVDISKEALKIAKENAIYHGVNVKFICSNLFQNVSEKFDIIVSNPPYIRKADIESLQEEVKNEPIGALDGGESGLNFYEKITQEAINFLNENGSLAFEIGFNQGAEVIKIMRKNDLKNIEIKKDISGNNRVVIGRV